MCIIEVNNNRIKEILNVIKKKKKMPTGIELGSKRLGQKSLRALTATATATILVNSTKIVYVYLPRVVI